MDFATDITTNSKSLALRNYLSKGSCASTTGLTTSGERISIRSLMPRKARAEVEGGLYHVITRGNNRRKIFHPPADYEKFVSLLAVQKVRLPFFLYAYCLMTNHQHRPASSSALTLWRQDDLHFTQRRGEGRKAQSEINRLIQPPTQPCSLFPHPLRLPGRFLSQRQ